ncbi:MAG: hypothetical protein HYS81_01415 [Candidatus Aenigmatarchaeota archaeon]|nr:MAG: hypothetical protein HYS81_01415 [Candidatus Aenigmarchaeota archaeon]
MDTSVQAAQLEKMKKEMLRTVLTKEAMERLGRVRLANALLASQLELTLVQMVQTGQARGQITDEQLKHILDSLASKKKPTRITRR